MLSCFALLSGAQDNKNAVNQTLDMSKSVAIWNYAGRALKPKNNTGITAINFFPSGNRLAFRSSSGIQICDVQSDSYVILPNPDASDKFQNKISAWWDLNKIFSCCNNFIIIFDANSSIVMIWSIKEGKYVKTLDPFEHIKLPNEEYPIFGGISSIALSPCGNNITFALALRQTYIDSSSRESLKNYNGLWSWKDKRQKIEVELEKNLSTALLKEIRNIICDYVLNKFEEFELEELKPLERACYYLDQNINKIIISPNNGNMTFVSNREITRIENGNKYIYGSNENFNRNICSVIYSADSRDLIFGLHDGCIYVVNSGKVFTAHNGPVTSLASSKCGKFILSTSTHDNSIKVWDFQTNTCLKNYEINDYCIDIVVSLCGRHIACALQSGKIILFTKEV